MRWMPILFLAIPAAIGQTETASITGTVLDAKTQKPVPVALVIAVSNGLPPFSMNTKSGADGAFQIQGLPAGSYSLCVQAPGDGYLDPCQWNGAPTAVRLVSGQKATGLSIGLTTASVVTIQVQDAQKVLSEKTKDGRRPDLTIGVWGPNGLYYPAHGLGSPATAVIPQGDRVDTYSYRIAVPRDTALKLHISSRNLRLGDAAGATLTGNASEQSFRHATGDLEPRIFTFTVLGLLP